MASYVAAEAVHKTLSGTTADTVRIASNPHSVVLINRHASVDLYYRADGTTPVAAADNTHIVRAGEWVEIDTGEDTTIGVVGDGNAYSVEAAS